ncbi:HAD family phosphatase [Lysinibacter sp. HNR]|uniref:HAD family hydrolase n=1 Tax=Lysinibacter sp. HNR TaxID=3031408 RepID=UPI0024359544|nr:HAD family phosphatase [Lysinibacter sp. HNR]WGD36215.1 HAD family phosphatase [Lysinibacter sp. HNR]
MSILTPAAVLWDMDGTIIDTEPLWNIAEDQLASEYNVIITDGDRQQMTGMGLWDAAEIMRTRGILLSEDQIVATLTQRVASLLTLENMPWRPGAIELLAQLHDAKIPVALVTMSTRALTDLILEHLPVTPFTVTVCGDEVPAAKPAPDSYLYAAQLLDVNIHECVAFEDSLNGLRAAWSAGTVTIGIPHVIDLSTGDFHELWSTLEGKTTDHIARSFSSARASTPFERVQREQR